MKKFKKTYIEITNVCNLSCDFCPKTKRPSEFMSLALFEHILKEIKGHSEHIYFHVLGEPFLHPELEDFIEMSYNYGFKVNITTNGTLINEVKNALLCKPSLRQVNFSLHSFDANTPNNSSDNYESHMDNYLNNIFEFTKEARSISDLIVSYRLWNLEETSSEQEKNRHVLNKIETFFNLDYKIEEVLRPGRGIQIAPKVYLNQASRFNWPDINDNIIESKGYCYGLRDQIAILVDGTVVPCCLDGEGTINLGNIKTTPFSEIIESKKSNDIYEGFSNREVVEELCKKCTYRKRFNI